jgi:hypothetical protein
MNDLISISAKDFETLLSYGKAGTDAYCLYSYFKFKFLSSGTNKIAPSNDTDIRKDLGWGKDKIQNAKNILVELQFLKKIVKKNEYGQFTENYFEVKE